MKGYISKLLPFEWRLKLEERKIASADHLKIKTIDQTIDCIRSRWPACFADCGKNPVFLFSSGWRSGSTLLQRMIMSDKRALIWGEPYRNCNYVQHQMTALQAIGYGYPGNDWFLEEFIRDGGELSDQFIANLYPDIEHLWMANRSFFENLLERPAIDRGYSIWGLKEVRLGIDAALYLQWLFPGARFLFLYRNPYHSYASLKLHRTTWDLYEMWPETPVRSPGSFGKLWANLITGFLNDGHKVNGLVIKYEDLCSGSYPVEKIEEYLEIRVSRDILRHKVSGTIKTKEPLTKKDVALLARVVSPLASKLGYQP